MRIVKLDQNTKNDLQANLLKRNTTQYPEYEKRVAEIVDDVKLNRDKAVFDYTLKFDKAELNASNVCVTEAEFDEAYKAVDPKLIDVIKKAISISESSTPISLRRAGS